MARISLKHFLLAFLLITVSVFIIDRVMDHLAAQKAAAFIGFLESGDLDSSNKMITSDLGSRAKIKIMRRLKERFPVESMVERLQHENLDADFPFLPGNSRQDQFDDKVNPYVAALKRLYSDDPDQYLTVAQKVVIDPLSSSIPIPNGGPEDLFGRNRKPTITFQKDASRNFSADFGTPLNFPQPAKKGSAVAKEKRNSSFKKDSSDAAWLGSLHNQIEREFAPKYNNGVFVSRKEVTGFVPHHLSVPVWSKTRTTAGQIFLSQLVHRKKHKRQQFLVDRLELMSARQSGQFVFESNHLPRLGDLSIDQTRKPDSFEISAWKELVAGKEIVARKQGQTVIALGAIRAKYWCRKCHTTNTGDLMGAFSYTLKQKDAISQTK